MAHILKSLNKPVSKRSFRIAALTVIVIEVLFFALGYIKQYNPVKALSNNIATTAVPTPLATVYASFENPLAKPMAVAIVNRRMYVSDTNNQRIQVFDYDGNPLSIFGSKGDKPGQFSFPYGIVGDSQGQIYVADLYNGNVSIFSPDGKFLKYLGAKGNFDRPAGLAFDAGKIYVTDVGKNSVSVYSMDGEKLLSFGKAGKGPGELASPNCVTHVNGKIYVTDTGNDRVEVFDDQGKFLSLIDGKTAAKSFSSIINPRGIVVDGNGTIYVVSSLTSKVQMFNQKGEAILSFGEGGTDDGQFQLPNGLTLDDQGRLYVTDTVGARIVIFSK